MTAELPILGFRFWKVKHGKLTSANVRQSWEVDDNEAVCLTTRKHQAPSRSCRCGYYAYSEIPNLNLLSKHVELKLNGYVLGAVVGWGKVVRCRNGWRAQYVRPIAIASDFGCRTDKVKQVHELGLPLIHTSGLLAYAKEHAQIYGADDKKRRFAISRLLGKPHTGIFFSQIAVKIFWLAFIVQTSILLMIASWGVLRLSEVPLFVLSGFETGLTWAVFTVVFGMAVLGLDLGADVLSLRVKQIWRKLFRKSK